MRPYSPDSHPSPPKTHGQSCTLPLAAAIHMTGKSNFSLAVGVPAFLLLALAWTFLSQIPSSDASELIRSRTSALHDRNRSLPEEPYLRDRARRISGRVTNADGSPAAGSVEVFGAEDIIDWQVLNRNLGVWRPEAAALSPQRDGAVDLDGRFEFLGPTLGNKLLIFRNEDGSAVLRYSGILVRDGVANGRLEFVIPSPALTRCALPADEVLDDQIVEALPLFEGFWPPDWMPVPAGAHEIEVDVRAPDGRPRWIALRRSSGEVELRVLSESSDGELAATELWEPTVRVVHGGPELVSSTETSLLFQHGFGVDPVLRLDGARSPETAGTLVVQAYRAFSPCVIRSLGCEEVVEYTDEFGEFGLQLPEGFYLVSGILRNRDRLLGATRQIGIFLPRGTTRRVEFYPGDEQRPSEPGSAISHGFVSDSNGLPIEGAEVTLSVVRGARARPLTETTDSSGFYNFRGISRDSTYLVAARLSKTAPCLKQQSTLEVDESLWEFRTDFQLPDRTLTIKLPADTSPSARIVLQHRVDEAWHPVWSGVASDQAAWIVESISIGTYAAVIISDGVVSANSIELQVESSAGSVEINAEQWERTP